MKQINYLLLITLLIFSSACKKNDDDDNANPIYNVKVKLVYPNNVLPTTDVKINITHKESDKTAMSKTAASGIATFELIAGTYDATVIDTRKNDMANIQYKGTKTFTITKDWDSDKEIDIALSSSEQAKIIIKELFTGGTPTDDNSEVFKHDKYVILYNNSATTATITKDFALATVMPENSDNGNNYMQNNKLIYEAEGWIPALQGVWHFTRKITIEPYSQIVIALANAVDNTKKYSKSINFANAEYFCTYHPYFWDNAKMYVKPEVIPATNYMKVYPYSKGDHWWLSDYSPGFFIFSTKNQKLKEFASGKENIDTYTGATAIYSKKIPIDWVIDGVEAFKYGAKNIKRLTANIDGGFVNYTAGKGYSLYRNVNKEATEAIEGNKDKLVYNYSLGTDNITGGSTDPSNIDAEESIKNGAIIIYQDTNNSTKDFHQRKEASLRNK